jgi:hypothetical protein
VNLKLRPARIWPRLLHQRKCDWPDAPASCALRLAHRFVGLFDERRARSGLSSSSATDAIVDVDADLRAGCSEMRRRSAGDEHGNKTSAPRPSARARPEKHMAGPRLPCGGHHESKNLASWSTHAGLRISYRAIWTPRVCMAAIGWAVPSRFSLHSKRALHTSFENSLDT